MRELYYYFLSFFKRKIDRKILLGDFFHVNTTTVITTRLKGKIEVINKEHQYVLCKYYPNNKPGIEAYIMLSKNEYNKIKVFSILNNKPGKAPDLN